MPPTKPHRPHLRGRIHAYPQTPCLPSSHRRVSSRRQVAPDLRPFLIQPRRPRDVPGEGQTAAISRNWRPRKGPLISGNVSTTTRSTLLDGLLKRVSRVRIVPRALTFVQVRAIRHRFKHSQDTFLVGLFGDDASPRRAWRKRVSAKWAAISPDRERSNLDTLESPKTTGSCAFVHVRSPLAGLTTLTV